MKIVQEGFDALGGRYLQWQLDAGGDPRQPYLGRFMQALPEGARVLDLGCGPGVPATRLLAERFRVTGVDVSPAQLGLARMNVPGARFIEADLTDISFPDGSFEGIVALFSVSHTPRAGHGKLFRRIAAWLALDGLFLANVQALGRKGLVHEWGGVRMYSSNHGADENRRLLREAGFELLVDEIEPLPYFDHEPEYLWVMGRKSSAS